jgi:hypothetical protein
LRGEIDNSEKDRGWIQQKHVSIHAALKIADLQKKLINFYYKFRKNAGCFEAVLPEM